MSIIGVSPSDFALLAKVVYKIYNDFRKGPQRIQGILYSLRDLAANAESLDSILEVANTQDYPKYGGFEKLKKDLIEAQLFLLKCLRSVESTNAFKKFVGATNLTISEASILEWQQKLADHRAQLESYKTSLIIRALYNNHRADTELNEEDTRFDRLFEHLLSRVEQRMQNTASPSSFRMTPRTNTFRSEASTLVPLSPTIQKRYEEIAGNAQALHLHERNQTPHNNPEAWSEFLEKVAPLLSDQNTPAARPTAVLGSCSTSPQFMRNGIESDTFAEWGTPSPQLYSTVVAELEGDRPTTLFHPVMTNANSNTLLYSLPAAPLILDDTRSVPAFRQNLRFSGKVEISSELTAKVFGKLWIEVDLEISQVEDVTYIWAISRKSLSPSEAAHSPVRGLTPLDILGERNGAQHGQQIERPVIFKHIIHSHPESFPVVHHPGVEKEQYHVEFYHRQLLTIEGISTRPEPVSKLRYRFANREDRDNMRANLFGRKLLGSAGYENIKPAGACDFQTITLWEESVASVQRRPGVLMTLPCNARGGQCGPNWFVVFQVTGCIRLDRAKKNKGRLSLRLVPLAMADLFGHKHRRRNSVLSTETSSSNDAPIPRRCSFPLEKSQDCEILLSESTDACKEDKRRLLRILQEKFEPG